MGTDALVTDALARRSRPRHPPLTTAWPTGLPTARGVEGLAGAGLAARMGFLLTGSAWSRRVVRSDSSQAVGIDGAPKRLADRP